MSREQGKNPIMSDVRRLQESIYSKETNYQFTIPQEHKETWNKIEQLLEHYDQIMSADSSEAMKALVEIQRGMYNYSGFLKEFKLIENALLQTQAREQELAELKRLGLYIIERSKAAGYHEQTDKSDPFIKAFDRFMELCKGSK